MYQILNLFIACATTILLDACDYDLTGTRKANELSALRGWFTSGKPEQVGWALETLRKNTEEFYAKFGHADLKDTKALEDGKDLLQLFLGSKHGGNGQLLSLQESLCVEIEVRRELVKQNPDYNFLVPKVLVTKNSTAQKHICEHIIKNPTDKNLVYLPSYFELLTPEDRNILFVDALKSSLSVSNQKQSSLVFFNMIQSGLSHKLSGPIEKMEKVLFGAEKYFPEALDNFLIMFPGSNVSQAVVQSSKEKSIALQVFASIREKDFSEACALLTKHKNIIPFFVSSVMLLLKNDSKKLLQCERTTRLFLSNCFTGQIEEALRLPMASAFAKKFQESQNVSGNAFYQWLHCITAYYVMKTEAKEVSPVKWRKLGQDFCAIDVRGLSSVCRQYGQTIVQEMFGPLYKITEDKHKKTLYEQFIKAGWDELLRHDWNCDKEDDAYLDDGEVLTIANRYKDLISADACTMFGRYYDGDCEAEKAYEFFMQAVHKGSLEAFEVALAYAMKWGKAADLRPLIKGLCCRDDQEICKKAVLENMLKFYEMNNNQVTEPQVYLNDYFFWCVKDRSEDKITDTLLLSQALYAKAFATVHLIYNGQSTVTMNDVITDMKHAYHLSHVVSADDWFNPLYVMPKKLVESFEGCIEHAEQQQTNIEDVAFATAMLLKQLQYGSYNENPMIAKGLRYIFSHEKKAQEHALFNACSLDWCKDISTQDIYRLLFLPCLGRSQLETCLKNDETFDSTELSPPFYFSSHSTIRPHNDLSNELKKSSLCEVLREVAQGDSVAAQRAIRLLLHYELHSSLEEAKEYAKRLCDMYKQDGRTELYNEAEEQYKHFVRQIMSSTVVAAKKQQDDQQVTLYNLLCQQKFEEPERQELARRLDSDRTNPINHALKAGECALEYDKDTAGIGRMALSLGQARRLGYVQPHTKWFNYITPPTKDIFWQKAIALCEKPEVENNIQDYSTMAYAVFLNREKSLEEKKKILQLALYKNALASLLYAQYILQEHDCITISALPQNKRLEIYKPLQYAVMQGQRASAEATDFDSVSHCEAIKLISDGIKHDLGSAVTLASVQENGGMVAASIISTNLFNSVLNLPAFETPVDMHIKLAHELGVLVSIETLAKNGNEIAQSALFRLYCAQAYEHSMQKEMKQEDIESVERAAQYGHSYLKVGKRSDYDRVYLSMMKTFIIKMIDRMIKNKINVSSFKKLKREIEKV